MAEIPLVRPVCPWGVKCAGKNNAPDCLDRFCPIDKPWRRWCLKHPFGCPASCKDDLMLRHRGTEASEEEKAAARERLRLALPHLFLASNMAALQVPEGKICLGTIVKEPSGGGRITASFESAGFLIDLDTLLGPLTDDEK